MHKLESALQSLTIDEEEKTLEAIICEVRKASDLSTALDMMYQRCEVEFELADALGQCCSALASHSVNQITFRSVLLNSLRKQCKGKHTSPALMLEEVFI